MKKNEKSELWEQIFADYNILEGIKQNGFYKITADDIRKYKEPRLMAKFDFHKQLPQIFRDNGLGILPIKNGEYIIGEFNLYENISDRRLHFKEIVPIPVTIPQYIETIDPDDIYSESNALNVALISGMIKAVVGENVHETIQGRMRVNEFSFNVLSKNRMKKIDVKGAAIEIDGGYEGRDKIALIEAKKTLSEDFIIRQLYYPYRHWISKVQKEIIPIFFVYESSIYTFFIYTFEDYNNYNSLKLVDIKRFYLESESGDKIKQRIFNETVLVEEKTQEEVPFPQADSFTKVLWALNLVYNDKNTPIEIADEFDYVYRQGKYYIDANRYLNTVMPDRWGTYCLTDFGYSLLQYDIRERNRLLIKEILKHRAFYEVYKYYLEKQTMMPKQEMIDLLSNLIPTLADNTVDRRCSTLRSWIEWIIGAQV